VHGSPSAASTARARAESTTTAITLRRPPHGHDDVGDAPPVGRDLDGQIDAGRPGQRARAATRQIERMELVAAVRCFEVVDQRAAIGREARRACAARPS
jgi:hypothetical protein